MKRENKPQLKQQINQLASQQQQNQLSQNHQTAINQNQLQTQSNKQKESYSEKSLDFIEDAKKRGWKGEQQFSENEKNQSGQSSTKKMNMLLGQIYYENYTICSASIISPCCLVSITQNQIKLRPQSLKFRLSKQQSYDIEVFEQKEIENYNLIVFRLKQSIGEVLGYFGVITYLDKVFYEQFDIQNKKKTVSIPHFIDQQYIADITDDSVILMKNKINNQNEEEIYEFLGLPLIVNDPFLGMFIIGLVIKSAQQNFKAILFQLAHLQFLKSCVVNKDTFEDELFIKEESKVIYQSNGDLAHKDGIYTICRLNNNCLASSSVDKSIRVWDWKGQTLLNNLDCDGCCRYFVCEDNMLVGTSENYVIIIDWHSKKIEGVIPCKNKLYSLLMYKHKTIFAGDCYGNINIINNSNLMYYIRNHEENPSGHKGSVNVMHKINIIPNLFFTAGEYGEIKVWDCEKFELQGEMIGHDKEKSVYYLESIYQQNQSNQNSNSNEQDNYYLISGSSDKTIRIWSVQTFKQIRIIQLFNPIYSACMINSSEIVIGDGNCIRIMSIQNQQEDVTIEKHESRVNAICKLSETSFASGDIEGSIITWQLKRPSISIKDSSDLSILSSHNQEKQTLQNSQNEQYLQKNKQPVSPQNIKNHDAANKYVLRTSNTPLSQTLPNQHQQENQATVKKTKPTFGYEEQIFEIIENENEKNQTQKQNSHLSNNQSPIMQNTQEISVPKKNFGEKMQINDIQFSNPFYESISQNIQGNLSETSKNQKKINNLNYPQSTQNARQPPQQKLTVEFFKEDPQNKNKETIDRGRKKIENQFSSASTQSQNQEVKRTNYNDKSPFMYKKGTQQVNQQQHLTPITNTLSQKQNNEKLNVQNDNQVQVHDISNQPNSIKNHYSLQNQNQNIRVGNREGYHSYQNSNNFISQKQQQKNTQDNLNQSLEKNKENPNENYQQRICNSTNTNYKNNSDSFNNQQPSQGSSMNTSDINSTKFQNYNSSSFVDLLKQFDDNDKYQIIHQKKLGTSTSPIQKSPTLNAQIQLNNNQVRKSLRDPVLRNQELKELQQHYDLMIDQYLSSKSNKNQTSSHMNDQNIINENQPSSNNHYNQKQLILDKKMNSKEIDVKKRAKTPDKFQSQTTPKQKSIQIKNQEQRDNLIDINIKNEGNPHSKVLSNGSKTSNTRKTNHDEQIKDSLQAYSAQQLENGKQNGNGVHYNQFVQKTSKEDEQEKDLKIEKLIKQNNELKEQLAIQNQQIQKYESQLSKLIETLQKSEEERVQIINEVKQVTLQLSKYSEITTQLSEKNEHQQFIIKKQEEEIVDFKEYIIDLNRQIKILKQAENGITGYQEEVSLNPILNKNIRIQEEKKSSYISSPQKQQDLLSHNLSNEKQHPSSNSNNYIHISEFQSNDDSNQQQFKQNISSPQKYKKQLSSDSHKQHINQNQQNNQELSPQQQNREQIMIQLRGLQKESLELHKEIISLKSKTSECQNESEMIQLLNQLQQTHSLYEIKNDEITELKALYNIY